MLQAALEAHARSHADYFSYERTVNSLLWPTGAWANSPMLADVKAAFERWWRANRVSDGAFTPEPYWLYFESAQAHNALLFGSRDIPWQVIDYRLSHQDVPGLYGLREGGDGVGTDNAVLGVTLINQLRGCQIYDDITPHGWSQSEFWLLQRALLIDEAGGGLLLFAGVPDRWLTPGADIGIERFPTMYGDVTANLRVEGRTARITAAGVRAGTPIRIRIGGAQIDHIAAHEPLTVSLEIT